MHCLSKKDQTNTSGINLDFLGQSSQSAETVKLLGITLDYKLNFNPHIAIKYLQESCIATERPETM